MRNFIHDLIDALKPAQKPKDETHALFASGLVTLRDQDNFPELLAQIAEAEARRGVREVGGNNRGPDVVAYQRATWLTPGAWAWCAAFVCWCVFQAIKFHGGMPWKRPETAGAWDFENWARGRYDPAVAKAWAVLDPRTNAPKRGDIVTFTWSHIGIVTFFDGNTVFTVEGNTGSTKTGTSDNASGDGTFAKKHPRSALRRIIRYIA